jgi:hypothetical protein
MVRVRIKQVNVKMSVPCDRSMVRVGVKQVNVKMSVPCDRSMVCVGVKQVNVKMSVPCSSVNGFFANEYNSHDLTEMLLNMDLNTHNPYYLLILNFDLKTENSDSCSDITHIYIYIYNS